MNKEEFFKILDNCIKLSIKPKLGQYQYINIKPIIYFYYDKILIQDIKIQQQIDLKNIKIENILFHLNDECLWVNDEIWSRNFNMNLTSNKMKILYNWLNDEYISKYSKFRSPIRKFCTLRFSKSVDIINQDECDIINQANKWKNK